MNLTEGKNYFENAGLLIPEVILPKPSVDLSRWAVVACDQFTSSPDYWENLSAFVGCAPSTLRMILPEKYLNDSGRDIPAMIASCDDTMNSYLESGAVFGEPFEGIVYVRRTLPGGLVRTGFIAALDLEQYDFRPGSRSLIRATEQTVLSRIPPRAAIRSNAPLELPHALVLVDDRNFALDSLFERATESLKPRYSFELNAGGGFIEGFEIKDANVFKQVAGILGNLAHDSVNGRFIYAVGDGNHSFAAAKAHRERLKENGASPDHPARFMLCEIENVNSPGIVFEPIHRLLKNASADLIEDLVFAHFEDKVSISEYDADEAPEFPENQADVPYHTIRVITKEKSFDLFIDKSAYPLAAGAVQEFLDTYFDAQNIDYIHGTEELTKTVDTIENSAGFLLPRPEKSDLFSTVERGEVLPRKTFSMGDAETKRYYLEARKIL